MNTLEGATKFIFSKEAINEAYAWLKHVGEKKFEAAALFAGRIEPTEAHVTTTIIPKQKTIKSKHGLMYQVEGEELHKINKWLYQNKLELIAQIHSHPTEAYHSEMDDKNAMITEIGGLSLVVPDFAKSSLKHLQWAFYRLSPSGTWDELSENEIESLIEIR